MSAFDIVGRFGETPIPVAVSLPGLSEPGECGSAKRDRDTDNLAPVASLIGLRQTSGAPEESGVDSQKTARARCPLAAVARTSGGKGLSRLQLTGTNARAARTAGHFGMATLTKLFDHLFIESRDVVRLAAGD